MSWVGDNYKLIRFWFRSRSRSSLSVGYKTQTVQPGRGTRSTEECRSSFEIIRRTSVSLLSDLGEHLGISSWNSFTRWVRIMGCASEQDGRGCSHYSSTGHRQCDHSLAFFTRSWLFVVHLGVLVFYRFSIIIAFPKSCEFLAFFIGSPWHL